MGIYMRYILECDWCGEIETDLEVSISKPDLYPSVSEIKYPTDHGLAVDKICSDCKQKFDLFRKAVIESAKATGQQ